MQFELNHALDLLERTPAALRALLGGLPADWAPAGGSPDDWNPHAVVGHLVHADETDWIPRAEIILEHGSARSFEPFDRLAQFDRFQDQTLDQLLEAFAFARLQSLARLKAMQLTPDRLALRGTHPELGPVSLSQLLATWVVHDLNHLGQIAEAMSKQYTEAVGPWRAYLPILDR